MKEALLIYVIISLLLIIILRDRRLRKKDPVRSCELYKDEGCAHVDGYLCDFPNCDMRNSYVNGKRIPETKKRKKAGK